MIFPEPRPEAPGAKSGAMWSIPREQLHGAAQRGVAGTADVLRSQGNPIIFTRPGAEIESASITSIRAAAASSAMPARPSIPSGNPTPFGTSIREAVEQHKPAGAMETPVLERVRERLRRHWDDINNPENAVALARIKENE
jgi:hypothetical protein